MFNLYYLIPIGLILIGILIFVFNVARAYRRSHGLKHYEGMRDKITLEELRHDQKQEMGIEEDDSDDDSDDGESGGFGFSISSIIGGFIAILIGVSLIGPIASQVAQATNESAMGNVTMPMTEMTKSILGIVPAFFAIMIAIIGIMIAWNAFRGSGLV